MAALLGRARGAELRRRLAISLLASAACADGPAERALPPPFREPRPLPGCEQLEYRECDVRSPECVSNLALIAACVRGGGSSGPSPSVTLLSEQEAEQSLSSALQASPPPSPNHFERALVLLELTQPSAFEPEVMAARLAQTYAAYYRRDSAELVVIDHPPGAGSPAPNTAQVQALVLHELIHALQDREHDLDAFAQTYQQDSDGNLRGSCVIEGEARLHEQRLYAALSGVDVASVDWEQELRARSERAEDEVFEQADLYTTSLLSVPYAHGVEHVQRLWAEQGAAGVRALFTSPPANMREILAPLWGASGSLPGTRSPPRLAPAEGLQRQAYSSLGAWGVYLLARPHVAERELARQQALAWRGDLLEAYSFDDQQTAVSWSIELATEADARALAGALTGKPAIVVRQSGALLRVLAAEGPLPPALAAAARPP